LLGVGCWLFNAHQPPTTNHQTNSEIAILATVSYTNCYIDSGVCYQIIIIMSNSPSTEPKPPSYVKLAMRNMVRKGGTSLKHFALTAVGLLAVLVGLAYLTH
jgi:Protein of unknown function (DUF3285)